MVEPDPAVRDGRSLGATRLRYEISVVPRWPIPSSVVSHLVKAGLPANITAIAERGEEVRRPAQHNILLTYQDCALGTCVGKRGAAKRLPTQCSVRCRCMHVFAMP